MNIYIATDANGSKHAYANVPYRSNYGKYWQGWGCIAIPLSQIDYSELEKVINQTWDDEPYIVEAHLTTVVGEVRVRKTGRYDDVTEFLSYEELPMFTWINSMTAPKHNQHYLVRTEDGSVMICDYNGGWDREDITEWFKFD